MDYPETSKATSEVKVFSSQQIPHQLISLDNKFKLILDVSQTQHCQTSNGHKRSVNKFALITEGIKNNHQWNLQAA